MVNFDKPNDPHQSGPPPKQNFDDAPLPSEGSAPSISQNDDKMWALCAHLSLLVSAGLWGPLIIWLVKKDDSPFVEDQAKEALNFHLSVLIASLVTAITCIGPFIVLIGAMVYSIIAAMESNKGVAYRYPYTFRMIT